MGGCWILLVLFGCPLSGVVAAELGPGWLGSGRVASCSGAGLRDVDGDRCGGGMGDGEGEGVVSSNIDVLAW